MGEVARTFPDAEHYFDAYLRAIEAVGEARGRGGTEENHSIPVRLSALHPRYKVAQSGLCVPYLTERLETLARAVAKADTGLTVDAGESERLETSFDIISNFRGQPARAMCCGWKAGAFGLVSHHRTGGGGTRHRQRDHRKARAADAAHRRRGRAAGA